MQKHVNLVDLVKSYSNEYFLAKFGVDIEENEFIKFDHSDEKSDKLLRFDIESFN